MKTYDDGAFTIAEGAWGFQSFGKEGEKIIFSQSEHDCVFWTRAWMKAQQEGWPDDVVAYEGVVAGKL